MKRFLLLSFLLMPLAFEQECDSVVELENLDDATRLEENLISSGHFGTVYKFWVRKDELEKKDKVELLGVHEKGSEDGTVLIALKILKSSPSTGPGSYIYSSQISQEQIDSELKAEANNLVKVNGVDRKIAPEFYRCGRTKDGKRFIAMEYMDISLQQELANYNCNFTLDKLLALFDDILYDVSTLHSEHFTHCDIKLIT